MVVLRGEEVWPRLRRLPGGGLARFATPVLVAAAALFGAAVSAVVLVGFWGTEAGRRQTAETKLAASATRAGTLERTNAGLRQRLERSHAASARLELQLGRLRAAARALLGENAALVASAGPLRGRAGSLRRGSASASRLAATLANDLAAVLAYVTNATPGSLDPSYLKAQFDYLRPVIAQVRSTADALGSEAGGYTAAIDAFAARTDAYAATLRGLARANNAR